MRHFLTLAIVGFGLSASSVAWAESTSPPTFNLLDQVEGIHYGPKTLPMVVKGAEHVVRHSLRFMLFKDDKGHLAVLKVDPNSKGCRFRVLYKF